MLAGLEPRDPAQPRHVEQYPAADETVLHGLDRVDSGGCPGESGTRLAVVEGAVERDVAERVDVGVRVVVVVDADVVLGEPKRSRSDVDVGEQGHSVLRRVRVVEALLRVPRMAERDRLAAADEPSGSDDAIGAELVESPELVVLAPASPVRDGLKERLELRRGHVDSAFLLHGPLRLLATARRMSRL